MKTSYPTQTHSTIGFDRLLESAVVLSWEDLMQASESGLVHVEYRVGPGKPLEYLKVWSSKTRGHWNLVCEWLRASPSQHDGLAFSNHYHSADLTKMLEFVMQHQYTFPNASQPQRDGLIQVHSPAQEEKSAAESCMREAFEFVGSHLAMPAAC